MRHFGRSEAKVDVTTQRELVQSCRRQSHQFKGTSGQSVQTDKLNKTHGGVSKMGPVGCDIYLDLISANKPPREREKIRLTG